MWGTLIFGHGEEKHEPKIIDDHKICLLYTSDAADDA